MSIHIPQTTQRVALFGGAFDPFHNGHAAAIKLLVSSGEFDSVLVVPSGDRPDKSDLSRASLRYDMTVLGVREVFGDNPKIVVSDLHSAKRVGYGTIDLLRHLSDQSGVDLTVVIGDELVKDLPQWKDADVLKQRARFLVLQRPGFVIPESLGGWKISRAPPFPDGGVIISSTELRRRLSVGESCAGLMPKSVEAYCVDHKLYRSTYSAG